MVLLERAKKRKTPLSNFDQSRQGSACNLDSDWFKVPMAYKPNSTIGYAARAIPRPIWAVVCRRRGLSQGYSSTTGLALQRSTSLPVITFLSWLILLGSWGSPGVWKNSLGNTAKCCSSVKDEAFAPCDCLWWLKTHADCIKKVEARIYSFYLSAWIIGGYESGSDTYSCLPWCSWPHAAADSNNSTRKKHGALTGAQHEQFHCEVSVPCPCAGGDNGSAMATVRPCANGGIIPSLPISMGLNVVPHNHNPTQRVHLFQATKATLQNTTTNESQRGAVVERALE